MMTEWISIKDKLPKRLERVLIASTKQSVGIRIAEITFNNEWLTDGNLEHNIIDFPYWMSLPELPKELKDE
jgi:Protein of unknown function (DUF551)